MKTKMKITFYELSAYNGGRLIPRTFDLDDYASEEAFNAARSAWLEELTAKTGRLCEEWIVADYEGVPSRYVGEWDLDPEFWTWREAVEQSGLDLAVFQAGAELEIPAAEIAERYLGEHDSPRDFAYDFAEERGDLKSESWLFAHIDWDGVWWDLEQQGFREQDHHYFDCSY